MKRDLLLGFALIAGFSAQAVTSPYIGNVAAEGTYYLYQVETGTWLQANRTDIDQWTTHASLDTEGFDIELKKIEGYEGFQIFCNYTNNGSLNGADEDRFFLDQADRAISDWIFEPVTVDGVSNAYKIMVKATPEGTDDRSKIANDVYIGANDGVLSDNPTDFTWQLVSRQERIDKMVADAANGPVDATWLIPNNELGRNDLREDLWTKNLSNPQSGSTNFDGLRGYPVQECWHWATVNRCITLTDLPNGTYSFAVQAFYRDTEIESADLAQRHIDGAENLRAKYYAGANKATVMSIFDDGKENSQDGYGYFVEAVNTWVPNNMDEAGRAFYAGEYFNDYIQSPVTDGSLTIGIEKDGGDHRDWLIFKRFYLRFDSTTPIEEDLSGLKGELEALITSAASLPEVASLINAVAEAQTVLDSADNSTVLLNAIAELKVVVDAVSASKDVINYYYATKEITDAFGVDSSEADAIFNTATSKGNYEDALKTLRYARRIASVVKQEDVFEGNEPTLGKFYLYNVGLGMFLCGGSDWGAHAALGLPGIEIELQDGGLNGGDQQKYYIETGLYNGDKHWLNYRGYMDADQIDGFAFIPVEGKDKVYNIVQGDYTDVHMGWNPNASTDAGNNDELTVGTECRNLDPNDLTAQWKLVTRAERDALIEKASLTNPVDLTHFIKSPGFNQRENAGDVWSMTNGQIWEYGANHYDFAVESWNAVSTDINQMVEGLPVGVYMLTANAFYRDGNTAYQIENEPTQNAILYAGETVNDVEIPNILSESGNAPGEGNKLTNEAGIEFEIPDGIVQATNYFKSGLYKVSTVVEKADEEGLIIGVIKDDQGAEEDWVVADNFRLYYYGSETTKQAVLDYLESGVEDVVVEPATRVEDNRIFNLQGIQVVNPTAPGIYIQNGKKFIVR